MQPGTRKEESIDANHHKVRQEMSCLYELEEFLHASSLQTSAKNMICQLFSPKNQKKLSSVNSFHLYARKSCKTIAYDSITHPYFNLYYWDYWYGIISQTKPKTWGLIWDNRHLTREYFLVMCYLTNEFISIFFFGANKLLT